jgi:hypothetical protein
MPAANIMAPGAFASGNLGTLALQCTLTDCHVTWSQLVAQQQAAEAPAAPGSGSALPSRSSLHLPAAAPPPVHFLLLHDRWALGELQADVSCAAGAVNGRGTAHGIQWDVHWTDLCDSAAAARAHDRVYSVSSPRMLPSIMGMDAGEVARLLSPDLDLGRDSRLNLTDSDLLPCSFVARRRATGAADDAFYDAPSVTPVPSLRLHQVLRRTAARTAACVGAVAADVFLPPSGDPAHDTPALSLDIEVRHGLRAARCCTTRPHQLLLYVIKKVND